MLLLRSASNLSWHFNTMRASKAFSCISRCWSSYQRQNGEIKDEFVNHPVLLLTNVRSAIHVKVDFLRCIRDYGTKAPKKEPKSHKGSKSKVKLTDEEMSEVFEVNDMRAEMSLVVDKLKDDFIKHLNVRTATGSIDILNVNFEGSEYPLNELAQVTRKNPQMLVINMTSYPQAIPAVLDALHKSGMNLNPQQDGTTIFVPVPQITREHREQLSKNAITLFNKLRSDIQHIQNKYIKDVKQKKDDFSEDLIYNVQQGIMAIAEGFINEADKLAQAKKTELLGGK